MPSILKNDMEHMYSEYQFIGLNNTISVYARKVRICRLTWSVTGLNAIHHVTFLYKDQKKTERFP